MQQQTDLFILFPHHDEYCSDEYSFLQCIELLDKEAFDDYIETFYSILTFINHEEYQGYYDAKNVNSFLAPLKELGERDYYPGRETRLRKKLNLWEKCNCDRHTESAISLDGMPIDRSMLGEIARNLTVQENYNYLLLEHRAVNRKELSIDYSGQATHVQLLPLDQQLIYAWFTRNRLPKRQYNDQYKKHGENGSGHQKNESSLLCSHQEAAQMLHQALGDSESRHLYFYDRSRNAILEFRFENTTVKSYHAFHTQDYKRIPIAVKRKIENLSGEKLS